MHKLVIYFGRDTTVFQRSAVEQIVRDQLDILDDGSYYDLEEEAEPND